MAHVFVEEAICESALLDASRSHRIVLSSSQNQGLLKSDLKSVYIRGKPGVNGVEILWKKPFGDKRLSVPHPSQLTITLHERRHLRPSRDIGQYVVDCSSDCIAKPVTLSPLNSRPDVGVTIRLVVTISGNASSAPPDTQTAPVEGPSNAHLTSTPPPTHEISSPATPSASDGDLTLQVEAEAEMTITSEGLAHVNPQLAHRMDQLEGNGVSIATGTAKGLASVLSNLDGIVNIVDLLADVHPLVKGAWSLVNAAYQIARTQADLDKSIISLIDAMNHACNLAKDYAPLKGRHTRSNLIFRDILREVIKGANVIKAYCEKRPKVLSALRTLGSDLAQEADNCFHALSALWGKLLAHTERESVVEIGHAAHLLKTSADNDVLREILYAKDADRALRNNSHGCLFGTRTYLTDAARDWAAGVIADGDRSSYLNAFDPESPVIWICGVAGVGKSSIAITVAKALEEMGLLGSMYSFEAANQATLNPTNLFSTIVHHLAQHNPQWKQRLIEIIRETKPSSRATSSPKYQFEHFFLALLAQDKDQIVVQPTVVIIDAFDESGNIGNRSEILNILTLRAHEIPPGIRIIITSRYEPDVEAALASQPKNVSLVKMEHIPKKTTERDINTYVQNELKDVQGVNTERFVPQLTELALAAEELFQWASTACAFIRDEDDGDGMLGPEERLSQVLESNEGLDNLYRTVLDRYFGGSKLETLEPLLALFGCLAYTREPLSLRSMASLTATWLLRPNHDLNTFHRIARKLTSLVMGTQDLETPLVALHTSFTDFLQDVKRSRKYYVDPLKFHERLATCCLSIMDENLRFNICKIPTSLKSNAEIENIQELIQTHIPNALSYACRFWAYHLSHLGAWTELDKLRESVTTLLKDRVLEWLEVMSLTETVPLNSLGYLERAHQIPSPYSELSDLVHETYHFAAYFGAPIMKSAAHIYLSALPFTPTSSHMFHHLRTDFKKTVQVTSGELVAWPTTRHILEGHTGGVSCVAFSPVGHLIASSSLDETIRLWDNTEGRLHGVLRGHSDRVLSVVFSPDGTLIASGSTDRTIRIWDVATHTVIGRLKGHSNRVLSVVFSPDGALIASGSDDDTIRIWDVKTRTALGQPLEGHSGSVESVAFSPDGTLIASGSDDKAIRLWDVATHTAVGKPLEGHTYHVRSVVFSPDGTLIASGAWDNTVRIWDTAQGLLHGELRGHSDSVESVAFSPNGTLIASSSLDRTICIWNVTTCTAVGGPLEGHSHWVRSVAFSPDGSVIVSGSEDCTIRVWDITVRTAIRGPSEGHSGSVKSIAFSRNGALLASGSDDHTIRIWDVKTHTVIGQPLEGHSDSVQSVALSPNSMFIASGSSDGTIRVWNSTTHTPIGQPLNGHSNWLQSVRVLQDGIADGLSVSGRALRLWDAMHATYTTPISGGKLWSDSDRVRSVVFSPDSSLIASGSGDQTIRLWDVGTRTVVGEPLMGHHGRVRSVAFSLDGSLIASGSEDWTIRIWDVGTRTVIGGPLKGHSGSVKSVAFSPNGALVASGSNDQTIRLWDVGTRTAIGEPLEGHTGSVKSVAFSPDGALIASGSADRTIRIWDVRTRTAIGEPLEGHSNFVESVVFSPDGMLIASGSEDSTVRIWDIRAHASIANHSSEAADPAIFAPGGDPLSSPLHQTLVNPRPSLRSMRKLHDGWIVGPQGELILWIPPTLRLGLGDKRMLAVLGRTNVHPTLLDFDNMAYASDWAQCRTIDS